MHSDQRPVCRGGCVPRGGGMQMKGKARAMLWFFLSSLSIFSFYVASSSTTTTTTTTTSSAAQQQQEQGSRSLAVYTAATSAVSISYATLMSGDELTLTVGTTYLAAPVGATSGNMCTGQTTNDSALCLNRSVSVTIVCSSISTRCELNGNASRRVVWIESIGGASLTTVTLEGLLIKNGRSPDQGAGIYIGKTTTTIKRCTITLHTTTASSSNSAIYVDGGNPAAAMTAYVISCAVTGNTGGAGGTGGIFARRNAVVWVTNTTMTGNLPLPAQDLFGSADGGPETMINYCAMGGTPYENLGKKEQTQNLCSSAPTASPTRSPTKTPTKSPTSTQSPSFTGSTRSPTKAPTTMAPSNAPTLSPTHGMCPSGKYSLDSRVCANCLPGTYSSSDGSVSCSVCTAGTFASGEGQPLCTTCPGGRYNSDEAKDASFHDALDDCVKCPTGRYLGDGGTDSSLHVAENQCLICEKGSYADEAGTVTCAWCPSGTELVDDATAPELHDSAADCVVCSAGYYRFGSNVTVACSACIAGRYLPDDGTAAENAVYHNSETKCLLCAAGQYSPLEGSSACEQCGKGKFIAAGGNDPTLHDAESDCTVCDLGKFTTETGASVCQSCGTSNEEFDNIASCVCKATFYDGSSPGSSAPLCLRCPTGADCSSPGTKLQLLPIKAGYWRSDIESARIEKCIFDAACIGWTSSNSPIIDYCAPGYTGPLCAVCDDGFAPFGAGQFLKCVECSGGNATNTIALWCSVIVVALVLSVCLCLRGSRALRDLNEERAGNSSESRKTSVDRMTRRLDAISAIAEKITPIFKVIFAYYQVVGGLSFAFDLKFPSLFTKVTTLISGIVNVNLVSLMPLGCVVPANYHRVLLLYTGAPLVVVGLMFALYLVLSAEKFNRWKFVQEKIFGSALLLSFLILPTMSMKVFSTFPCQKFDNDYGSYLKVDYSINCESDEHVGFLYFAAAMVVVYPVGIPLSYYLLLRKQVKLIDPGQTALAVFHGSDEVGMAKAVEKREALEKKEKSLCRLKFLYGAYEPKCWWFEVFETLRKIALTGGLIFFGQGTASQIVISQVLCLLSMRVYAGYKPFVDPLMDIFAETAQWQLFFTMFAALAMRVNLDGAELGENESFDNALVVVQFVAPFVVFCSILQAGGAVRVVQRVADIAKSVRAVVANEVEIAVVDTTKAKGSDRTKTNGSGRSDEGLREGRGAVGGVDKVASSRPSEITTVVAAAHETRPVALLGDDNSIVVVSRPGGARQEIEASERTKNSPRSVLFEDL